MSYFSLRKRPETEAEPEPVEEEQPEEIGDEPDEEPPAVTRGPILTGLLGPGTWIAVRFGTGWAWGVHVVAVWAISYYRGWIAVGVPLVWLLVVLAFIPREFLDRLTAAIERRAAPPSKPPAAPLPGGEREAVRRLLLDLMGEAPGVHLRTVLAHLQEHGQWEGRTVTDMRARLTLLGIPHDRKVKVARVPTWGVRRADLEASSPVEDTAASPAPSPPV
jgi:hypothetical protein